MSDEDVLEKLKWHQTNLKSAIKTDPCYAPHRASFNDEMQP